MPLFPMFVGLSERAVLVVGAGEVATRKVQALLHAGARVRVHAHHWSPALLALLAQGRVERLEGPFDPTWMDDAWLAVAATDDEALNQRVAEAASARHRWVNVVDDAARSTYQVPAVIDRAPLQIAISSAGAAPMLARRLRERLETLLEPSLGPLATLFEQHRAAIRSALPEPAMRRRWFDHMLDGPLSAWVRAGDLAAAESALLASLAGPQSDDAGHVALVGCHAAQADLLTLRALRLLNQADHIMVVGEVADAVLVMARRDAPQEQVGAEENAAALLARRAQAGQRVVCLRAGGFDDAFGGALATALQALGVSCERVPAVREAS
ncbi:MAG TPA: bifunctional precorrin-2 dehydrogenase/sirohydrochlorin ferrochelatase [Stenotrophomonas sp.]|nr:bifunctional precorrin-2 dehydrogenase/sirohydrochlorin ferrochelatase [Stenotrophomonas sp.]